MSTSTTLEKTTSIAIGGFDGMHRAHQELFNSLTGEGAIVAIETGYANMTPGRERQAFTQLPVIVYDLETIRHLDDQGFMQKLQNTFPHLNHIVVGYDFRFGKDRRFDASHLQKHFKGRVEVVSEIVYEGISVHSHIIRERLKAGDIKQANALLSRAYCIGGEVIKGQGLGSKEFVPTLNISSKNLLPCEGVYVTNTYIDNDPKAYASISFVGKRHTTDGGFAVETHILDREIAEVKSCRIEFLDFLRGNRAFETKKILADAIDADIEKTKQIHRGYHEV